MMASSKSNKYHTYKPILQTHEKLIKLITFYLCDIWFLYQQKQVMCL